MKSLKRSLLNSLVVVLVSAAAWAGEMNGGNFTITKDLPGATGTSLMSSADYGLAMAWGEPASGDVLVQPTYSIISGYFGGGFGNGLTFTVVSSQIGAPGTPLFFQDGVQVGLPYNAPVQVVLSDQVLQPTIASGVQAVVAADHLGVSTNANVPITITYNPFNNTLTVTPQGSWTGNTLYDIQLSPQLLNVDGFPLDQMHHIYFQTMLDPRQENIVMAPIRTGAAAPSVSGSVSAMAIQIPTASLSDYATVLLSRDALNSPLRVNPQIIQDANTKALAGGGPYRAPLSIQEIIAYDTKGNLMSALSSPAQITIDYGSLASGNAGLIRPRTLALWVLDEAHQLWVKIPASQSAPGFQTVSAPVSHLSVFALMGSPDGSASDSFVFPVPWRPHGPNPGSGPGQSGTEAGGIVFSNLPSECSITIYTLSGERVRQIHHSDTGGLIAQEVWDVKTTHGDAAASGVYLWRVESSVDGKNGKLMIIR